MTELGVGAVGEGIVDRPGVQHAAVLQHHGALQGKEGEVGIEAMGLQGGDRSRQRLHHQIGGQLRRESAIEPGRTAGRRICGDGPTIKGQQRPLTAQPQAAHTLDRQLHSRQASGPAGPPQGPPQGRGTSHAAGAGITATPTRRVEMGRRHGTSGLRQPC